MTLRRRLTEKLEIEHTIISAPMAFAACEAKSLAVLLFWLSGRIWPCQQCVSKMRDGQ
jgi:hypothetical protein